MFLGGPDMGSVASILATTRIPQLLVLVMAGWLAACAYEPLSEDSTTPGQDQALTDSLAQIARASEAALDYSAAADHYRRLSERLPQEAWVFNAQARNLRYAGQPRDALKVLRAAAENLGDDPFRLELAKAQFAAAMTADAFETLLTLAEQTPEDWQVHALLGMMFDRQERYDQARTSYAHALELSPNNPSVINNLSLSLAQAGELDEAVATLERLVAGEHSTLQARQNLTMLYVIRGDMELARSLAARDLTPEQVDQNISAYILMAR